MKLLVFDGNSIINRAFYAIHGLSTRDGRPTNAIFGFLKLYMKYFDMTSPDMVAVTFDLKAPTFRHKLYDGYKAQRKGMPEELAAQLEPMKEILRLMNVCILEKEGFEADDLIGTLAKTAEKNGDKCFIVTGDRDSFQLVSKTTTVLLPVTQKGGSETQTINEAEIERRFGLTPGQLIDVKAIMGDSSDNIKGVAGIGEKGAVDLIRRFSSLDGVYEHLEDGDIKPAMRSKLIEHKEMAYLSRRLAEICCDVPLDVTAEDMKLCPPDDKLADYLTALELGSVVKQMGLSASVAKVEEVELLENVDMAEVDAFVRKNGCFFLMDEGYSAYIWIDKGVAYCEDCKALLLDDTVQKITFDAKPIYRRLQQEGVFITKPYFDVMVAQYVLDPSISHYTKESVTMRILQVELDDKPYTFAALLPQIFDIQRKEIEERGQMALLQEVELPLTIVLSDMELEGFTVDKEKLENYRQKLLTAVGDLEQKIYEAAGETFNILSPKQLGIILFEKLGLKPVKKTKTGYSTNADALEKLAGKHEIVALISEYRTYTKLLSTYCDGLLKLIDEKQKIHTSFQQTVTQTGRISSTEPNLQNIPVRTPLGRELREMFIASDADHILMDADYSQIELRVLAHIADDKTMLSAFKNGEDIHTATAATVFNLPPLMITDEMRRAAKAVNFGIVYGISDFSLSQDLHVSRKEAAHYIEEYLNQFDGVRRYMEEIVETATKQGYVTTLLGRRRDLPELASSNFNIRSFGKRVALNTPIQGTAADIIKIAMVRIYNRLKKENLSAKLIMQVHDELIIEAPKNEELAVASILQSEMENAMKLNVSLLAEVHSGASWNDCK